MIANLEVHRPRSNAFFTEDDELMPWDGKTFALTKQWGQSARNNVDRIIKEFDLEDISYHETS